MLKFDYEFPLKGSRNYVHGTDMVNFCVGSLTDHFQTALTSLYFSIHRMTVKNLCLYVFSDTEVPDRTEADNAVIRFTVNDARWTGYLRELQSEASHRIEYNEDSIRAECVVDQSERSITLSDRPAMTDIETIVAMTKVLHTELFPPSLRWVFCRLECPYWPGTKKGERFKITLTQTLGTKLTRSEIKGSDGVIGSVYFSAKEI